MPFGSFLLWANNFSLDTADKKRATIHSIFQRLGLFFVGVPHIGLRLRARKVFSVLNPKKGETILDAGCGVGLYCFALERKGCNVTGIDFDKKKIAEAKKISKQLKSSAAFYNADARKLSFAANSFDKAVCADVIEHIVEDGRVLQELSRVLKKHGLLALTVPNITGETIRRRVEFGHMRPGYSIKDIENLSKKAGLRIEKVLSYQGFFGSVAWKVNETSFNFPFLAAILFYPMYLLSFLDELVPQNMQQPYGWIFLLEKT